MRFAWGVLALFVSTVLYGVVMLALFMLPRDVVAERAMYAIGVATALAWTGAWCWLGARRCMVCERARPWDNNLSRESALALAIDQLRLYRAECVAYRNKKASRRNDSSSSYQDSVETHRLACERVDALLKTRPAWAWSEPMLGFKPCDGSCGGACPRPDPDKSTRPCPGAPGGD